MNNNKIHIIPDYSQLEQYTELAGQYGFHFEYDDFFIPDFLDDKAAVEERLRLYQQTEGVPTGNTLHGSFLDVTIFSADRGIREHSEMRIRESMELASRLNCKAIIIHTNYIPSFIDEKYYEGWLDCNERFIRKMIKEFPTVSIYMENMFDTTPDLIVRLSERLKDVEHYGVCFDYAHANVFGQVPLEDWVKSLAPYVKHMHINDNDGIRDLHQAIGDGSIDYGKFLEYYDQYFDGATVLLEMNGLEKIRKSVEYLEKLKNK